MILAAALALAGAATAGRAQEPLNPPTPIARNVNAAGAGGTAVKLAAARRAQDLGMPSIAVEIYRSLLDLPGVDRSAVSLALVTALLDSDRAAEAEQVLLAQPAPQDAAWRLRVGLAALRTQQRGVAQVQADGLKPDDLTELDRPWYWFLLGVLYDTATPRDVTRANENYRRAEMSAPTDLTRARFQLAGEQVRLNLPGRPSEADLRQAKENSERFAGRAFGYDATRNYAVMLAVGGQHAEAVATLQRALVSVPVQERAARDELRFVLGLVGDRGRSGAGRSALIQLLENGQNPERQRQALELLAEASREEPARGQFRSDLDKLIAVKPPHPVRESLWYYRAQLALADKDYARAEEDTVELLKQFPLSPLRVHALGVLIQSAWEQRRYRLAADYARKARSELAPAPGGAPGALLISPLARVDLGVLEAEASYRAGDFRNAADAYAAVLRDRPPELEPRRVSELMYQQVLAEIKAGSGDAARILDELERDPVFDLESRWQAEWSLARALQLQGEAGIKEAFARINALLADLSPGAAALNPGLRARMLWLQAKLSFDHGQPEQTVRLADAFLGSTMEIEGGLKTEIASIVMLLKARAEFSLGRETVGLETLRRLRVEYPKTDAAVSSFLIEAEYYAAQDKIDEARNRLISLTDNREYKDSEYVPLALFRLAVLSERLGREENLQEANKRIEELVKLVGGGTGGTEQSLLFAARLRQGDIFRKLNDFPAAQRAYEDLVNRYPQRADVVLAQLALAECHNAQSSSDPSGAHADSAQLLFEQLRDRVGAPRDVRVEAGYNLGALLARRGKIDEAARVWWQDVVSPFLIEETHPVEQDAKRPYWLARTLLELGELQEKRTRFDEAKEAYQLLLTMRLPYGEAIARARLQQLGVPPKAGP